MLFFRMKFVYIIRNQNYKIKWINFIINVIGEIVMYNAEKECRIMIDTLKVICAQKNLTPYALAKKAGISTSTISYLINGRTKPQVYTMLLICNALDISISQLFEQFEYKDNSHFVKYLECEMSDVTCEEESMLHCYRRLSNRKKRLLKIYIDMLLQYDDELLNVPK